MNIDNKCNRQVKPPGFRYGGKIRISWKKIHRLMSTLSTIRENCRSDDHFADDTAVLTCTFQHYYISRRFTSGQIQDGAPTLSQKEIHNNIIHIQLIIILI